MNRSTWIDVHGVRVSVSKPVDKPWRVRVGGRIVFESPSRGRAGDAFAAIVAVLRECLV